MIGKANCELIEKIVEKYGIDEEKHDEIKNKKTK